MNGFSKHSAKTLTVIAAAALALLACTRSEVAGQTNASCGCLDIALCVDNTGSMGGAIDNVRNGLTNIIAVAQQVTGGDLRMGALTFVDTATGIQQLLVWQPFSADIATVITAVNTLPNSGGAGAPEATDEMVLLAVSGAADSCIAVVQPKGPFGFFRSACGKIVVLVTDAPPAGCDDTYTAGVDDVHAAMVASNALASGVFISAITVGTDPVTSTVMSNYAAITGGIFTNVAESGIGTGDGLAGIIAKCGGAIQKPPPPALPVTRPPTQPGCITRNSLYWFTHAEAGDPACVALRRAIEANGGDLKIGFLDLPTTYRNTDNVVDAEDAVIEALGFYWRGKNQTGEDRGRQTRHLPASRLCRARKPLAAELIAAIANNVLLGTGPTNCPCLTCADTKRFPAGLIEQAGAAAAGEDVVAIQQMTALLKKFNSSGKTNDFAGGLAECSQWKRNALRAYSQDPTTHLTCPGINDSPSTAEAILSFPFNRTVDLTRYASSTNSLSSPPCGTGGVGAVWKIEPAIAIAGSQFTVDTAGSNFDTLLSVGSPSGLGFTSLVCANPGPGSEAKLSFTADGSTTYYIVAQGQNGAVGYLKLKVTSP